MLQNAYFVAKIGADTAENEQHFSEILPTDALCRALRRRELRHGRALPRLPLPRPRERGGSPCLLRGRIFYYQMEHFSMVTVLKHSFQTFFLDISAEF